jgi:hypothetical protein
MRPFIFNIQFLKSLIEQQPISWEEQFQGLMLGYD